MRSALATLSALSLLACATPSARVESPRLKERWPTLRTLGLVTPVVEVPTRAPDADAWKREAEEVVLATFAAELQKRGVQVLRVSPQPATREGLAKLAQRFDDGAELAARAEKRGERLSSPGSLGDLAALSRACGVDGFLVASGTAVPPSGPPRPASVASPNRTSFQAIHEAASGEALTGEADVRLSWLAAAIVDESGQCLWFATEGTPGEEEGDPAVDAATELAERLPGRKR